MFKALLFAVFGSVGVMMGSMVQDTDPGKEKVIQQAVIGILDQYHYSPEEIDDSFSAEAFDFFLEYMDGRKRFYTQKDIDKLSQYKLLIDDQIHESSFTFFDAATEILQQRIGEAELLYKEILAAPFDYTRDEEFLFDKDTKPWAKDQQELEEYWRKQLKYDALLALTAKLKNQKQAQTRLDKDQYEKDIDKAEDEELINKTMTELEEDARAKVLKDYDKWYKSFQKLRRSDRFESYLNAFAHLFDPHSDYLNPKEKQDFDINMGGKLEGIGARLQTDGDLTKIVSVVPGGPAWKSKQIEPNDHIIRVEQEGADPISLFGMRLDDVVSQIRGKKGTLVTLSVKKKDGSIIDVTLERDVINIKESYAKSAILDLEGEVDNIGYIDLPKFYSSFEGEDGTSCAKDVAKEIEKLKANNVEGIILDLRGNGGGSLSDVIDMSGLFIEEGPIVQVKPRDRRAYVYKDQDKSVLWDGPLIVMINSFSASASEILAAAMQDYDRAIIVGSQSFGKGTVQRFVNLDRTVQDNENYKPLGQLKITMQTFYRVNGGSTQLKGVTPDISFPDKYRLIDVGEREYPYALEWSQLAPASYAQDVYQVPSRELLRDKSAARLSQSEGFDLLAEQGEWYKSSRDKKTYSLNLQEHQAYKADQKEKNDLYKSILGDPLEHLSITNLPQDEEAIAADEESSARNEDWIKTRKKDLYLEETLRVMKDMIANPAITSVNQEEKP